MESRELSFVCMRHMGVFETWFRTIKPAVAGRSTDETTFDSFRRRNVSKVEMFSEQISVSIFHS